MAGTRATGWRLNLTGIAGTPAKRTDTIGSIPLGFYADQRQIAWISGGAILFALIGSRFGITAILFGAIFGGLGVWVSWFWRPRDEPMLLLVGRRWFGTSGTLKRPRDVGGNRMQTFILPKGKKPPPGSKLEMENTWDAVWSISGSTLPVRAGPSAKMYLGECVPSKRIGSGWGTATVSGIIAD